MRILRVLLLVAVGAAIIHRGGEFEPLSVDAFRVPWLMAVVVALAPLNLSAEARKWAVLVRSEHLPFKRAFAGVLNGMCVGFVTPNRIGEVVGRWRMVPREIGHTAAAMSVTGSALQGLVTALGGVFGLLYYPILPTLSMGSWPAWSTVGIVLGLVAAAASILYFLPRLRREILKFVDAFREVSPARLMRGLGWAALRYLVFGCQLVVALHVFGFSGTYLEAWAGVGLLFFIQSYLPGAPFAELGVREVVAAVVFAPFFANPLYAAMAAFAVWTVNVVLPIVYTAALRPKWIRALGNR